MERVRSSETLQRELATVTVGVGPRLVRRLAGDTDPTVRAAAVQHPYCDRRLVRRLAGDTDPAVRAAVASRDDCSREVLARLVADPVDEVRAAVAAHPGAEGLLSRLSEDTNPDIRAAVASNTHSSTALLERLARDTVPDVREAALERLPLTPDGFYRWCAVAPTDARCVLLRRSDYPPELRNETASSPDAQFRAAVAANPNCSEDVNTLVRLAGDRDPEVLTAVASNPNCPAEKLASFARSGDVATRVAVASNPNCPPRLLKTLTAANQEEAVVAAAAANPRLAAARLGYVMAHHSGAARDGVVLHPGCPAATVERFSHSLLPQHRRNAARHPHCHRTHLERLVGDIDPLVAAAARSVLRHRLGEQLAARDVP